MFWKKLSHTAINERVQQALKENTDYRTTPLLGIPGSFLDEEEFYPEAPFLEDSPFLATMIANPNHIGCHTLNQDKSEPFFRGTQKLEIEVIELCSEEIFEGEKGDFDGYIAPGGTEANIEAVWIYRNYFIKEYGATCDEIALVYSEDSHYSMPKAGNLLNISSLVISVDNTTRLMKIEDLEQQIQEAIVGGIKHFIVIQNMATTMFGSIDNIDATTKYLNENNISFKLHVDGAFGGFIYPFTAENNRLNFTNEHVSSITVDGHKMLQTPYGTGIFLIRKGLIKYAETEEAKYVHGKDYTICGSRSGANAISVWMTLKIHGSDGWKVKMHQLLDKTERVCTKLNKLGVEYYRHPEMNIIAIRSQYISLALAKKYNLIPNSVESKKGWWKIVVMQHVKQGFLDAFISDLTFETQHQKIEN